MRQAVWLVSDAAVNPLVLSFVSFTFAPVTLIAVVTSLFAVWVVLAILPIGLPVGFEVTFSSI
jgi:hypothetical protein